MTLVFIFIQSDVNGIKSGLFRLSSFIVFKAMLDTLCWHSESNSRTNDCASCCMGSSFSLNALFTNKLQHFRIECSVLSAKDDTARLSLAAPVPTASSYLATTSSACFYYSVETLASKTTPEYPLGFVLIFFELFLQPCCLPHLLRN